MKISLAPLQGFTDFPLRNAFYKIIGGTDKFYTPYLKLENDSTLRKKFIADILPENNAGIPLTPQILVNNFADFKILHDVIKSYRFNEINLNLGCPYPMVANRKLGSGLLPHPEFLKSFFEEIFAYSSLKISIKFRSGYQSDQEIFQLINVINQFPFHELIYHPRVGKQLYKGKADVNLFAKISQLSKQKLAYNGDIESVEYLNLLQKNIITNGHFMIGRGLLKNPFLAQQLKGKTLTKNEKQDLFFQFHEHIYMHYNQTLSGDAHVLNKMTHLWEYFSHLFINQHKVHKSFKKCKNLKNYELIIKELLHHPMI